MGPSLSIRVAMARAWGPLCGGGRWRRSSGYRTRRSHPHPGRGGGHLSLLGNGSLVIEEFGWRDRGEYSCYVDNMLGNDTQSVQLELEPRYRHVIYMWSLLYGLVTAVSFLGNKNIP